MRLLRRKFERNPDMKYGFVVYRTTYADDAQWEQFMNYLNIHTRRNLNSANAQDFIQRLDWNVQDDREKLDGASPSKVREEFRKWVENGSEANHATSRHHACVMVDQEALETIFKEGLDPEEFDSFGESWVYLVSKEDEGNGDYDAEDWIREEDGKREKVWVTRVGLSYLVPRVFELLDGPGWHNFADPYGVVRS